MYGQRNQTPDFVVGNGPQKCSQVGCTITSLANLFSVNGYSFTPQQVNDALMKVGGFSGQLIIWSAIQKAFPFVTGAQRVKGSYDNTAVSEATIKYGGCLVEVEANPIGNPGGTHWVLFTGNLKCFDPWNDVETPTANWNPVGYTLIQLNKNIQNDPATNLQKELDEKNIQIGNLQAQVNGLTKDNSDLSQKLGSVQADLQGANKALDDTKTALANELNQQHDFADQALIAQNALTNEKRASLNFVDDVRRLLKLGKGDGTEQAKIEALDALQKLVESKTIITGLNDYQNIIRLGGKTLWLK